MDDRMRVIAPARLPASIPCQRHRLAPGARLGYKPNVVQLGTGELLLANFHTHYEAFNDGCICEHIVLHRSADGGATWTSRHHDHLWGREPYLNRFSDDVLLVTTHFLPMDVRNRTGRTTVYLHRSDDGGGTWSSTHLDVDRIPAPVTMTCTSRNILEMPDGTYLLGVGCGYGQDFVMRSADRGRSWQVETARVLGADTAAYEYSVLQEGVFCRTDSGRLVLLARCDPRRLRFSELVPGLPQLDAAQAGDSDHYDVEVVFASQDAGRTWRPVSALPIVGCMYPSLCSLDGGRYLFTYTQRIPAVERHMGVYALLVQEDPQGRFHAQVEGDVIVVDEKTPDCYDSGGGFGNTLRLRDGSLLPPYSFLEADPEVDGLMHSGAFLEQATFERYRDRALPYYRSWVEQLVWERVRHADPVTQRHVFMGCAAVLNLCGPVTEICRWRLDP